MAAVSLLPVSESLNSPTSQSSVYFQPWNMRVLLEERFPL